MDQSFIATIVAAVITAVATIVAATIAAKRNSSSAESANGRPAQSPASKPKKNADNTTGSQTVIAIAFVAIGQMALMYVSFARLPLTAGTVGLCVEAGVFLLIGFGMMLRR